MARCHPPWLAESRRRRRVADLFAGQPVTVSGLDLGSWNVSIAASTRGDDLVVRVLRQLDAGATDAYFPDLYVSLLRPRRQGEYGPRTVAYRRAAFVPAEHGARAEFSDAAIGSLYGYRVDVRPAGSWVCQGANDGCQKRYAMVEELLELTEQARANPGTAA